MIPYCIGLSISRHASSCAVPLCPMEHPSDVHTSLHLMSFHIPVPWPALMIPT